MKHLVIDGHNMAYRAGYVHPTLHNKAGKSTGVGYGMLKMIRTLLENNDPEDCIICWDVGSSKIREGIFPDYKANRKKSIFDPVLIQNIKGQIDELIEILPIFGIKQLKFMGLEADDLIGLLAKELKDVLVVSNDKDMFQLLDLGAEIYYPAKESFLNKENFKNEFGDGLDASQYLYFRTITGDSSDGIPGLHKFGKVTAKKLILKHGPWINWYNESNGEFTIKPEVLEGLNKGQKAHLETKEALLILCRNYELMEIGKIGESVKDQILEEYYNQKPTFNDQKIKKFFEEFEFNSYVNRFGWWIHPFRLLNRKES